LDVRVLMATCRAAGSERKRRRPADIFCGAGDERDFTGEFGARRVRAVGADCHSDLPRMLLRS
jgi:hypothetical protein